MSTFSERLKEAASEAGIPRARLAERIGMGRANMSHWWTGRATQPTGEMAAKAAEILGVEARWLSAGEGPKRRGPNAQDAQKLERAQGETPTPDEQAQEMNKQIAELVRAWINLPGNQRARFKREIETLALQFLPEAPDSRLPVIPIEPQGATNKKDRPARTV